MKKKLEKHIALLPGDLALVHVENKPAFFTRIEGVDPDHRRGWWRVKLLVLNLPLKVVTWILDNDQIRGADFTMGGVPVRLERIVAPSEAPAETDLHPQMTAVQRDAPDQGKPARILVFKRRPQVDENAS